MFPLTHTHSHWCTAYDNVLIPMPTKFIQFIHFSSGLLSISCTTTNVRGWNSVICLHKSEWSQVLAHAKLLFIAVSNNGNLKHSCGFRDYIESVLFNKTETNRETDCIKSDNFRWNHSYSSLCGCHFIILVFAECELSNVKVFPILINKWISMILLAFKWVWLKSTAFANLNVQTF